MNLLNKSKLKYYSIYSSYGSLRRGSMKNPLMKPVNHIEREKVPCKIRSNTVTNH